MANVDSKDEEDLDFGDDTSDFKAMKIEQGPSAEDDATIKELRAKVAANPNDANLQAQLARAYHELDADDEAAACYDAALALSPDNAAFLHGRGLVALANNDSHSAESFLEKALAVDPNNAEILYDLGQAFRQEEKHAKAMDYFTQAANKDPKHSRALIAVATYLQSQKPDEAIEYYKKALAADPNNASANFTAGQLLQSRGKPDDAKLAGEYFSKAVALDGTDPQYYAKLLQVYDYLGMAAEFDKTRNELKAAFAKGALNPNFQLVGRYSPSQFEVGDKFVMVFDHLKLLGVEPARFAFFVYKKGEVREDKILYRVSLLVAPDGKLSLHSFEGASRKHHADYPVEPPFHTVKADVIKIIQGK